MQDRRSPSVLLIAGREYSLAAGLPRLFRWAGIRVVLLAPPDQPLRASRFVDTWIPAPRDPVGLVGTVEAHLAQQLYDLVVFAEESAFETIARRHLRPQWLGWLHPEVADAMASRTNFARWAPEHGIVMPRSTICRHPDDAATWVRREGPSMMKTNRSSGGQGVRLVSAPSDVRAAWVELGCPENFLMQKFIRGRVGITELILRRGEVVAWFSSIKERTLGPFGGSVMRRPSTPRGMEDLVDAVTLATEFHGLCGFDWVLDEATDQPTLIEFHPRSPGGFEWGEYAGINVPAALSDLVQAGPVRRLSPGSQPELLDAPVCCFFPGHLEWAVLNRPMDLRYWLPGSNAVAWRNVPFDDPVVLGRVLLATAKRGIKKVRKIGRFAPRA